MALSKLGTEVDSTLSLDALDALDAISGGARLMLPGGAELEIDGTSFENGASRIFNDAYQYYFPNAPSNRVQDALQQREIRDAQSDLREMPTPMQMSEYAPMGETFGGEAAPSMGYAPEYYANDFG